MGAEGESGIIEQFELDPSLININKDIDYNEGYKKSKKEDIIFCKLTIFFYYYLIPLWHQNTISK